MSHMFYIPCNKPAVKMVGYASGEGPYRMCKMCADHNIRNRRGVDLGPYNPLDEALKQGKELNHILTDGRDGAIKP